MRKMMMAMAVGGAALLGVGAKAAPLSAQIPVLAAPHVQPVEWGYWRGGEGREHGWRGHGWGGGEWGRRDGWERERRHEAWERHRWEERREWPRYYGYRW